MKKLTIPLLRWLLITSIIPIFKVNAQSGYANIEVGKPMPATTFKNIKFFKKSQATLKDFKGKWLILDFWTEKCPACISAMPAMNQLQTKFASHVQFLSVGYHCQDCRIQSLYEKYRAKFNLTMPVSFDSTVFKQFGLTAFPRIIAIDPSGIVRGTTVMINEKDVQALLTKNKLYQKVPNSYESGALQKYDYNIPLLTFGNGGKDTAYLFRTILTKWNPQMPHTGQLSLKSSSKFELHCKTLTELYNVAYFAQTGNWGPGDNPAYYENIWQVPMLQVKDSSLFSGDIPREINIYSYGVYSPGVTRSVSFFQQCLQNDLHQYFGYNASVEERNMPYYKLERFNSFIVPKSSGKPMEKKTYSVQGFEATNISINQLVMLIANYQPLIPIVDSTGIEYNIDISIDCLMNDIDQLRKALQQKGLDLVLGEKKMKVLVIRDSN